MKKILLLCSSFAIVLSAWAQERIVTGKVTSAEDGTSIPGVNVVVKGTTGGTVADTDGKFSVSVPGSGGVLVFSFIGLKSQEVTVGNESVVNVSMEADITQLQEVVVSAIGETRPKDRLGIATATVTGAAITQAGESGLINALAGKAPGVTITRNGSDPGAGSFIQLRGQSTITGDIQPLIVIDGMPMYNDNFPTSSGGVNNSTAGTQNQSRLNDLNPADVASVEVIKGAAGAALWGSRAANGVIVITTKKGSNTKGKINVNYSGAYSIDEVNKMPELQRTFGQGSNGRFAGGNSSSYGDLISARTGGANTPSGTAYVQFPDGSQRFAYAAGIQSNPHGGKNSKDTFDHTKDVFGTGHYVENSLSLTGGGDRSQFYVSYSNLTQKGVITNRSDYNKNVARINFSTQLTEKFRAAINANYSNVRSNRVQQGSNVSGLLLGQLRTSPDFDNTQYIGDAYNTAGIPTFGKQISYRNPIGASANPGYDNPFWTINKNLSYAVVNRFLGNLELSYDFNDWLSLKGVTGIDTYTERRTDYGNAQSQAYLTGAYTEQYIQQSQWNTNIFAKANKKFSSAFSGSILLGFNYNNRQFNNVGATVTNFIIPEAPPNLGNSPSTNRTPFNTASRIATSAGFTEINASIADQVFVTLTGRAESASTFGPQAQSLFFYPSISAAWQFTKAIGSNDILNFGKLRLSAGVVGKQPDPYLNLTQYFPQQFNESYGAILTGSSYGVGGYAVSTTAGNSKIRPEKKSEIEAGFDLRFLNDRISLSATAFYNQTTDVILSSQLPPSSGFANIISNAGAIENKGAEVALGITWVKLQNSFTWKSDFIWSMYRNMVTDLAGAQYVFLAGFTDGSSVAAKDYPLGVLWGAKYTTDAAGKYVLDANGFPQKDAASGVIGDPNPGYRASLGNTFSYKNLSLYVLVEAMVGGQMWNGTKGALVNFGTAASSANISTVSAADAALLTTYDNRTIAFLAANTNRAWVNTDGTISFRGEIKDFGGGKKVPLEQSWYTGPGSGFNINQPFVEDASWARLREATLSYTFNSAGFKSATKLQSITVGLTGRNLLLWTPYSGVDPDTNLTGASNGRGLDYFQNPNTRSFLFKLSINY